MQTSLRAASSKSAAVRAAPAARRARVVAQAAQPEKVGSLLVSTSYVFFGVLGATIRARDN